MERCVPVGNLIQTVHLKSYIILLRRNINDLYITLLSMIYFDECFDEIMCLIFDIPHKNTHQLK